MTKIKRFLVTIVVFINAHYEEVVIKSLDPTLLDEKDMNFDERIVAKGSL